MRTVKTRAWLAGTVLLAAVLTPTRMAAQPGGMPGGMNAIPSTLFGAEKERASDVTGLSVAATDEPVTAIRIEGNQTIPTEQVINQLRTRVGRPFDPALVQRDVRKLMTRGWFVTVDASYEQVPGGREVIFKVAERPVIRYVEYLGNLGISNKKLARETDLKMGGPVDPYAVEEARRRLLSLYRDNGYNDAQVTILEGTKPTDQGVVFGINEGEKQKVWNVEFVGANFVYGRRLKTRIETKPPILKVFKGFLDRDQVDADVERLTNYYRSFGFFQARVGRQIEFNEQGNWATVRFVIHEGPRYEVRDVRFVGNQLFATASLAESITLPAGEPFEQSKMNADVEWLKTLYGSQGYVFADVRGDVIFLEEPGQLDLVYHVEEGKQWRVGNIYVHIDGDTPHTRIQTALNRLSIRPGEIVDIREVKASERRLQASGLFMTDPVRGVMPKITYRIQELGDTEFAGGGTGSFRGQSPDRVERPVTRGRISPKSNVGSLDTYALGDDEPHGLPLLPPPGTTLPDTADTAPEGWEVVAPSAAVPSTAQTYRVVPPPGFVEGGDQFDFHLHLESGTAERETPVSPTAVRHEVRRFPYRQADAAQHGGTRPPDSVYQGIVVRTQSPYQEATTQPAASSGGQVARPTGTATAAPPESGRYGGYPVQQTQAHLPPPPGTIGAPTFGPPPLPTTQPGTTQPFGPTTPSHGPAGGATALPPDPSITPVAPLPTNPQIAPAWPVDPFTPQFSDPAVDLFVDLAETQTGRLMLGVAVNSDAGLIGQVLIDEQNFDWTRVPRSMEDIVSGRAWRGAGQRFRLEAAPGTVVQRYLVSFQEPYLWDTPISLGLSGSFFDRRYRNWDEQRLGGRASLGYQWVANDVGAHFTYRGENINIRNIAPPIPELEEVRGDNVLHGFKVGITNDTRDSTFLATQGHFLQFEAEQVVGSFIYPRTVFDGRKYFLVRERPDHSGRHVISTSTRLGFSGKNTPVYENFFAGGFASLRGFDFRGASPVVGNVEVGGRFMWVNSVEYLFPLTADDMIHGVVFTDFGTVERNVTINDFRVSPGFGLRVTIPAMGPAPIALDFAFPIASADFDDKQVFSFSMGLQR